MFLNKLLVLILFTACGFQYQSGMEAVIIRGQVQPLFGLISSTHRSKSFFSEAWASSCNAKASLYALDVFGHKEREALAVAEVQVDASFMFELEKFENGNGINHLIEVKGEGLPQCELVLTRLVAGDLEKQNVGHNSTLLGFGLDVNLPTNFTQADPVRVAALIQALPKTSSMDAYHALENTPKLKTEFEELFGVGPTVLRDAVPKIFSKTIHDVLSERVARQFKVVATHWDLDYDIAYHWKIDGETVSNASSWIYTPSGDSDGMHVVSLYVGKDNGSGDIDPTKPYFHQDFTVMVVNTIPPTPPAISTESDILASGSVEVKINTGPSMNHCDSFARMAITVNEVDAPTLFPLSCTEAGTQIETVDAGEAEGEKILRLWVQDSSGRVSAAPTHLSVYLDNTAPTVALALNKALYRGGESVSLDYSALDASPLSSLKLSFSTDGSSYVEVGELNKNLASFQWTLPTVDTSVARFKLTAQDIAGNSSSVTSEAFIIDATAPALGSFTLTSPNLTKDKLVTATLSSCAGVDYILLKEGTEATEEEAGWVSCSTSLSYTLVAETQGSRSIKLWAKDQAGNISAPKSITVTYDTTPPAAPALSITSPNPTNEPELVFQVQACTDIAQLEINGSWVNCVSGASHTLGLSAGDGQKSFTIYARDEAGNVSAGTTLNVSLDQTPPVLTRVVVNPQGPDDVEGDQFTGTANVMVRVSAIGKLGENIQLRLLEVPSSAASCESQWVDDEWFDYQPAVLGGTQDFYLTVAAMDGVKKICAWVKDDLGNISEITSEVAGVNMDTILYEVGNIPVVSSFSAINSSAGVRNGTTDFLEGEEVTITYSVTDVEGLHTVPVALFYSEDNLVWKDTTTQKDVSDPENITWFGAATGTTASDVMTLKAPSSGLFKYKLIVRDRTGNTGIPAYSDVMNGTPWSIYAGNIDNGDGGTALAARMMAGSGTGHFIAVHPTNNDLFALDQTNTSIRKLDARTGIVSTFISHGTSNLTNGGTLPSKIRLPSPGYIKFDSKGRLYVQTSQHLWQLDLEQKKSWAFLGSGGTNASETATPQNIAWARGSFTFDEEDSLYIFAKCAVMNGQQTLRIMKVTQDASGKAQDVSVVAGNCQEGAFPGPGPVDALNSPLGSTYDSKGDPVANSAATLGSLAVWGKGRYIYYYYYRGGEKVKKIIDGLSYDSNVPVSQRAFYYSFRKGKLYSATGSIQEFTPNLTGANGDVGKTIVSASGKGNCVLDGVSPEESCVKVGMNFTETGSGLLLFTDGSGNNASASYRIRYIDPSSNTLKTLMGSLPFFGDGYHRDLARGTFSGIYYKQHAGVDEADAPFKEGLYFMDKSAIIFGHINPVTQKTEVLFGNQSHTAFNVKTGNPLDKNVSLGGPYSHADAQAMSFDENGLPWFRFSGNIYSVSPEKTLVPRMNGSKYYGEAKDGDNPREFQAYVTGANHNLTLKGEGVFMIGVAVDNVNHNRNPSIRLFDFDPEVMAVTRVMGDKPKANSEDTLSSGEVKDLALNCVYSNSSKCYSYYDKDNDTLFFAEAGVTGLRLITKVSVPEESMLKTLTTARAVTNYTFRPDKSELYYLSGGKLYCKKLGSTGNCDETSLGPPAMIGSITAGPNQFTWVDNDTLLVSTYNGLILRYQIPAVEEN